MSDNPGDSNELLNWQINVDTSQVEGLGPTLDEVRERITALQYATQESFFAGKESAAEFYEELNKVRDTLGEQGQTANQAAAQIEQLAEAYRQAARSIYEAAEATKEFTIDQVKLQEAVREAKLVGMEPSESDFSGDTTNVGSAFAIGHGLSVAGHATGSPALREVGALVYIEESLRRVGPLFTQLNTSLEASGGLIPPLTDAFIALNVPMAGVLATAIPLVAAAATLAVMLALLKTRMDEGKEAIGAALDRLDKFYSAVNDPKATERSVKDDLNTATQSRDELVQRRTDLIAQMQSAIAQASQGDAVGRADRIAQVMGSAGMAELGDRVKKLNDQIGPLQATIDGDKDALDSGILAQHDLNNGIIARTSALGKLAQAEKEAQEVTDEAKRQEILAATERGEASKAKLRDQGVADRVGGYQALSQGMNARDAADEQARIDAAAKAAADYIKEIEKAQKDALDNLAKAADDFKKKSADLVTSLATQQENARQKEADAEQQYMRGSLEDVHERGQIATAESRKETELKQQTADKIADIALKEQQKEASIQDDFRNQLLEDQIKVNQDSQKLTTDFQRTEREDSIEHEQRLADIKSQSHAQDQAALLDRNFLQLAKNQLTQNDAESKENISFQRREDKLARHLSDQQQDLEGHYAQEIAQQQWAETRKILLAQQAAFNEENQQQVDQTRKITALRASEQQQLDDLTANETYKIAILQRNLANELILYTQQEAAKMKLLQATTDAINQQAKQAYMNSGGDRFIAEGMTGHAQGGGFLAGEPFVMNEPGFGNETLMLGSRGYNVGGAALVYPMQGGSVNANKGDNGLVFAPTINAPAGVDRAWLMGTLSKMKDDMWEKLQDIHG